MKTIILNVCQGVGDIFWVYQKFEPYVDGINFCITHLSSGNHKVQTRANGFLNLLPKVQEVSYRETSGQVYEKLAKGYFPMKPILKAYEEGHMGPFDYACNAPLEAGIRLEDLDPEYPLNKSVDIRITPFSIVPDPQNHILAYISGGTMSKPVRDHSRVWTFQLWADFIDMVVSKCSKKHPIILMGADYDRDALVHLEAKLGDKQHNVKTFIDAQPSEVCYMLKNCRMFLGYQSGLNVIAANYSTRQIMMYFPQLRKMLYTFCKPEDRETIFHADTFNRHPLEVVADIPKKFLASV